MDFENINMNSEKEIADSNERTETGRGFKDSEKDARKERTPEEEIEKKRQRNISDAELLKGGAEYRKRQNDEKREYFVPTEKQERKIKNEMEGEFLLRLRNRVDLAEKPQDLIQISVGQWFKGIEDREKRHFYYKEKIAKLLTDRMWYGDFKPSPDDPEKIQDLKKITPNAFGFGAKIDALIGDIKSTKKTRDIVREDVKQKTSKSENLSSFLEVIKSYGGLVTFNPDNNIETTYSYLNILRGLNYAVKNKDDPRSFKGITRSAGLRDKAKELISKISSEEWEKIYKKETR